LLSRIEKFNGLHTPEAATSLIGLFCSLAMKPITEKMANPEKKLVPELMAQTISDCLIKTNVTARL
jgi:hypothetical protein